MNESNNITKVVVVGCGNMGGIILSSLKSADNGFEVSGIEKDSERSNMLSENYEMEKSYDALLEADIAILAVKPQQIGGLIDEIRAVLERLSKKLIIVSIAAGIKIEFIKDLIGESVQRISIVRVMPNTPALIGKGITAVQKTGDSNDIEAVSAIFKTMGDVVLTDNFDAVTALSGSGPAYLFYIAEILENFALASGFNKDEARIIASKTIEGAGSLMAVSKKDFQELRKEVTSSGGTTEAAFEKILGSDFRIIFIEALDSARRRSKELSENNGD